MNLRELNELEQACIFGAEIDRDILLPLLSDVQSMVRLFQEHAEFHLTSRVKDLLVEVKEGSASYEELDAKVATFMANHVSAKVIDSNLVNEGGGIHTNGNGSLLATETVQLGIERNPDWTRLEVEAELNEKLGTDKVIWIRRGLTRDYETFGTKGHIDIVACFADENTLLVHDQQDQSHPDYSVTHEVIAKLEEATNCEIIKVPAPKLLKDELGFVDYSYINHYILNDAVLLCAFDDPQDQVAKGILQDVYPGREIRLIDARPIFDRGGGIHCITQQQPAI
jgi:agmatine deiminase